jgi:DNA-binding NtrC family response regulator
VVDVRFVAATHKELLREISAGRFRKDLYFRLNGLTIFIPPLRKRQGEILPLARSFLAEVRARTGRGPTELDGDALQKLLHYTWPGNVRELRNVVERAAVLCPGDAVGAAHLVFDEVASGAESDGGAASDSTLATLPDAVSALERDRIVDALARSGNNQTQAAKLLGISRRALINRLDALGLPRPRKA